MSRRVVEAIENGREILEMKVGKKNAPALSQSVFRKRLMIYCEET